MLRKLFSRPPNEAIPEIEVTVAVTGGYIAWEKAGLPTETSAGGVA